MQKLKEKRIQIIRPNSPIVNPQRTSKKTFSFWGLFSSSQSDSQGNSVLLKGPTLKSYPAAASKIDLEGVRSWVALEERIVHDYKSRRFVPTKPALALNKQLAKEKAAQEKAAREKEAHERKAQERAAREKAMQERVAREEAMRERMMRERRTREKAVQEKKEQEKIAREEAAREKTVRERRTQEVAAQETEVQEKAPIFETLSVQTVTSVPSFQEKIKAPHSENRPSFFRLGTAMLSLGWLVAGLLAFFYSGEASLRQQLSVQLAESYGENQQLEKSMEAFKMTASEQRSEIQKLNGRIQGMAGKLSTAQTKAAAFEAMEKSYREELLRVTTHYEGQMDHMRKLVQVREDLVMALQAQVRAIDKLVSEGGLATAFTAAVKAMEAEKKKVAEATQGVPQSKALPQGEVVMVNRQYQFIVVNLGADQGAQTGGLLDIFHNGKSLAKGRLERIYPSMSAVTVLDDSALEVITEGDKVSFS